MLHLAFGERALLADDMGLGKTIQAIAACELLRRLRGVAARAGRLPGVAEGASGRSRSPASASAEHDLVIGAARAAAAA